MKWQFSVDLRKANITPLPKGPSSADLTLYRPISITPVLLKVIERLLVGKLSVFLERCDDYLPDSTHIEKDWDVAMHCWTFATRRRQPRRRVVS